MRSKWIIILLIFSLAVNMAAVVTMVVQWSRRSEPRRPFFGPPFSEQRREMLRERLDLTDDQYRKVGQAHDQFAEEMDSLQAALRTKREELFRQLETEEPDRGQIEVLLAEIAALQADQERKVVDNLLSMKEVLTPEQRERLHSLLGRRFGEPRDPFGPRERERGRPGGWRECESHRPE
jgi:Spy/CpxP family protein refolding chaperone